MSRWLRWQFVVPRVLLCVVFALGAQFVAGLILRSFASRSGTQLLNAPVKVASARGSLSNGRILLGSIRVADPCGQGKCWFTAEGCELEVATEPLLTKQLVISKAQMNGVRIEGLAADSAADRQVAASADPWFGDHAAEAAENRLATLDDRFNDNIVERLESVRRATAFCTEWPKEIAALSGRAAELERGAAELEKTLSTVSVNQLRHDQSLDGVPGRVGQLRKELESLSAEFEMLPQRLEEERRAIVAARRHDEEVLRGKMHVDAIDAKLLNAYLLRRPAARQLDDLMACLRSLRRIAPAVSAQPLTAKRGQDVLFAGMRPTPNLLIQSLELHGEALVANRPVEFGGLVSNLTTTPSLHGEPIRLRFSGRDSARFELRANIDRRGGRVHDELFVECGEMPLGEQAFGRAGQLELNLAPSTGALNVSVTVDGDRLSGEIQLVQKELRITPAFACEKPELPIGDSLDQSLGRLESLATRISLEGTIDKPTCTLWSNLGPAVAEALQVGSQHCAEVHSQEVLAAARQQVDEQLAELERQVAEQREKFAVQIASMPGRLEAIARTQTPRERMTVEQIGRRLPTTSILR